MSLNRVAAITGYAEIAPMKECALDPMSLYTRLAAETIADAGFEKGDIDGLITTTPYSEYTLTWSAGVADSLGMELDYIDTVDLGGASSAGMIWRAAAAIKAGLCRNVLCIVAATSAGGGSVRAEGITPRPYDEYLAPYGISLPTASYAMLARRHMHQYGTTPEQMAKIAVDQRTSALLNPDARFNKALLTIDEVLASPLICDPLHLLEVVSRCAGGAAVLVSAASVAKSARNPPVWLLGAGEAGTHLDLAARPDITQSWIQQSSRKAYDMAGIVPAQLDCVQIYDCYTITVLVSLEDMGLCAKGHGGPFVAERDLSFAGDLPCNTNGGQLSMGQPGTAGGMIHVTEAVRQLMNRAGPRQVRNATLSLAQGNGGIMGEQVTLIFGNQ